MNSIQEAKEKLERARTKQRNLRKKIDALRKGLADAGENPDAPKIDLIPRNKKIYRAWKMGKSFIDVGKEFNLSTTRIASICHRIDVVLDKKVGDFDRYKDLLKYK